MAPLAEHRTYDDNFEVFAMKCKLSKDEWDPLLPPDVNNTLTISPLPMSVTLTIAVSFGTHANRKTTCKDRLRWLDQSKAASEYSGEERRRADPVTWERRRKSLFHHIEGVIMHNGITELTHCKQRVWLSKHGRKARNGTYVLKIANAYTKYAECHKVLRSYTTLKHAEIATKHRPLSCTKPKRVYSAPKHSWMLRWKTGLCCVNSQNGELQTMLGWQIAQNRCVTGNPV